MSSKVICRTFRNCCKFIWEFRSIPTFLPIISQISSTGERLDDRADHERIWTLASGRNCIVTASVWTRALYCWNITLSSSWIYSIAINVSLDTGLGEILQELYYLGWFYPKSWLLWWRLFLVQQKVQRSTFHLFDDWLFFDHNESTDKIEIHLKTQSCSSFRLSLPVHSTIPTYGCDEDWLESVLTLSDME